MSVHFQRSTSWEELGYSALPSGVRFSYFTVDEDQGATDAPVVFFAEFAPGAVTPPHSHECDYAEIILEGSQQVTRRWHHAGDVRIVRAGTVYGPLVAGPEGCRVLVVFKDHRWVAQPADADADGLYLEELRALHG
jgi:hypothetical protein